MPDRIEDGRVVDVLAEIFETVHVQSASITRLDLPLFSAAEVEASKLVEVYVVLQGRLTVVVGTERVVVNEGDVFCLPRGEAHVLGDDGNGRVQAASQFEVSVARLGDRAREGGQSLLRGSCVFSDPEKNPLLGVLPSLIHVSASQWAGVRWLSPTIELLVREACGRKPGASSVIGRVLELLLVQLVRTHVATSPAASHGWLRALSDVQIGGALGLIHEKPAETFTVAGLAHAVGMSRSAFALQFTRLVGEPPLHYVARWRMLKAGLLLKDNKLTLAEIASTVGYESEAAFSKAFKRWSGHSPGCYRRENRGSGEPLVSQALAG